MSRSAVLIAIPEAEKAVDLHRRRFDPAASNGIPAHVTLLFPFVPAAALNASVESDLAALFARSEPFACAFADVRRFDQDVLWLAPDPTEPFVALTEEIERVFPGYPPFEGTYDEVVPHLTIAHSDGAAFDAIEREVKAFLPIEAHVTEALLMVEDAAGRWSTRSAYGLGS